MSEARRQKRLSGVQTKLVVNQPGDRDEQEADRIADQVMRMPDPTVQRQAEPEEEEVEALQMKSLAAQISPLLQHEMIGEENAEEAFLQARGANRQVPIITSPVEAAVQGVRRGGGQPLDPVTRAFMEPRFGHDFGRVQVHTDARAANSARAVNALAYTVGHDVVFAAGQYQPRSGQGRRLLAHELSHVVQQSVDSPSLQRQPQSEFDAEEERNLPPVVIPLSPRTIPIANLTSTPDLPDTSPAAQAGGAKSKKDGPTVEASVKAGQKTGETQEVTTNIELVIPIGRGGIPGTPIVVGKSASLEVAAQPEAGSSLHPNLALNASIKLLSLELKSSRFGSLDLAGKAGVSHEYRSPTLGPEPTAATSKTSLKGGFEAKYKPPLKVLGVQPYLWGSVGFKVKPSDKGVDVGPIGPLKAAFSAGVGVGFTFGKGP